MMATSILPELFPLSKAMVARLSKDRDLSPKVSLHTALSLEELEEQMTSVREHLAEIWTPLLREVEQVRARACEIMDPALQQKWIEPDWFLRILQEHTFFAKKGQDELFTAKTVYRWRDRGLLRYEDRSDHLKYETALAVLMMRLADHRRERGFLPPGNHQHEPYMYVWRQDSPTSPLIPCGLPLSEQVPNHAFLYTRWHVPGLLHPDWLLFGNKGSVRWRGTIEEKETLLWNLSEEELGIWDPTIVSLGQGILDTAARHTRHTLANLILLKRATLIFQQALVL